jgi:hypothetical protein
LNHASSSSSSFTSSSISGVYAPYVCPPPFGYAASGLAVDAVVEVDDSVKGGAEICVGGDGAEDASVDVGVDSFSGGEEGF